MKLPKDTRNTVNKLPTQPIGKDLRDSFERVRSEPIPDKLKDLIAEFKRQEQNRKSD